MKRSIFAAITVLALIGLGSTAPPAEAVGTSADTGAITNGFFSGTDTVPRTYGRVSVGYFKTRTNADSKYQGPSTADTVTVDTGYDLTQLYNLTVKNGSAGDTATFVYWIENLGNATYRIDLDTKFIADGALDDTNWGRQYYTIFYDRGSGGGDSDISGDSRDLLFLTLPPGAFRQVVVSMAIPDTAVAGDSSHIMLEVTDNAALITAGAKGDSWQAGVPLVSTEDSRDTMWDTVVIQVVGPNVIVSKTCTEVTAGRSRPGDTLICTITFDNDGDSEAKGVYIFDAIPQWTKYRRNTADSAIFRGNSNQTATAYGDTEITVAFDTDPMTAADDGKIDFKDTEGFQNDTTTTYLVTAIRWTLEADLAANADGDAFGTVQFNDNSATLDNGRVEFRIIIE